MLSDTLPRSGKNGSPKRACEEIWLFFCLNPRSSEGLVVWAKESLAQARRSRHYNSLAQAREISLSEMDILAWAEASRLSENSEDSCSQCLIKLGFAMLSKNVLNNVHMIVMLGLKD